MEPFRTAQELPDPLQEQQNGFQMKLIKEEDLEDEHYFYGGTSTSVERQGFTNPIKKEECEDEDYLCGGTSTCVEEEKITVEPKSEIHLSQTETKSILKPSDHHSDQPLHPTESLQKKDVDKPYPCQQCGKRFLKPSLLLRHERVHTGEKPFQCSECGRAFSRNSSLKVHMHIHTEKKLYECSEWNTHQALLPTETLQKEAVDKPYPCPQCGKKFQKQWMLHRHQRVHTGEKPYQCLECGRAFSRKNSLKVHMRIHTEKKLYQCSECKNNFVQLGHLKMHQSVHAREILLKY